jgi:hypothetical protein
MHVPEMPRKPLTEVQEFTFHADARALERAEFDQKVLYLLCEGTYFVINTSKF